MRERQGICASEECKFQMFQQKEGKSQKKMVGHVGHGWTMKVANGDSMGLPLQTVLVKVYHPVKLSKLTRRCSFASLERHGGNQQIEIFPDFLVRP